MKKNSSNIILTISIFLVLIFVLLNEHIFNIKINYLLRRNQYIYKVCLGQERMISKEIFHEYASKKLDILKKNLDKKSIAVLDYALDCMEYERFYRHAAFEENHLSLPAYQLEHEEKWQIEKKNIKHKYDLCGNDLSPEVFYFHHGLRFTNEKVKNYIKDKDIIDCGAFIGDSLLILQKYTDKIIYCYEFAKKNVDTFYEVMKTNNKISGYVLTPMALGESEKTIKCNPESAGSGASVRNKGDMIVKMTTIDAEVQKHNMNVGFIKMDVEGYGMQVIRGAIETIKAQRPVLSLGIYHNSSELFGIKPYLEQNLENYLYEFKLESFDVGNFNEMVLFCYPKELMK